ncbi:MAG: DUF481 domain-containing protein [Pseudomonadota bacterium]
MLNPRKLIILALLTGSAAPLHAELPAPVKAMLEAAIKSGIDADVQSVAKIARKTNPDDVDEINAMVARHTAAREQIEKAARQEKLEAGFFENWSGEGEIGAFRTTGNSSNTGLSGGLKLNKDAVKWRLKFLARADYQRSNGVTTREQFKTSLEPEYKFDDRFYAYGLGMFERDQFQGFDARYTLSGGLGYSVIRNDDVTLNLKAGPAWRLTEFADGGSDSSLAGLLGIDFDWQISRNLKLSQDGGATVLAESDGFASANAIFSSGSNTFTATTALDAKLIGRLSARFAYTIEHETDPPDGRVKTDTQSRATLIYDF